MCAVPPRQSKNSGGARRDVDSKHQVPVVARPLLPAGETRQRGRAKGYLPLWRVAWRCGHCVTGGKRGHKEFLCVRDCTGLVRKKTRIRRASFFGIITWGYSSLQTLITVEREEIHFFLFVPNSERIQLKNV